MKQFVILLISIFLISILIVGINAKESQKYTKIHEIKVGPKPVNIENVMKIKNSVTKIDSSQDNKVVQEFNISNITKDSTSNLNIAGSVNKDPKFKKFAEDRLNKLKKNIKNEDKNKERTEIGIVSPTINELPNDDWCCWGTEIYQYHDGSNIMGVFVGQEINPWYEMNSRDTNVGYWTPIYYPTIKAPDPDPLEVTATYFQDSNGNTNRALWISDLSDWTGPKVVKKLDSPEFLNKYIAYQDNGYFYYTMIIDWPGFSMVLLYNFASEMWEIQYFSRGAFNYIGSGWNIAELHAICPNAPEIESINLQVLDPNKGWITADETYAYNYVDLGLFNCKQNIGYVINEFDHWQMIPIPN